MDRAKKFKLPPMEDTQGQRRKKLLEEQRRRRLLQVDSSRNINSFANMSLNDSSDEENQEPDTNTMSERMEIHAERPRRAKKRKTVSKWANMVMYAEPLDFTSIPEDLQTDWIALAPVPKGKRCIMATSRSSYSTSIAFLRSRVKGNTLMRFPTNLPSDTILDCILDEHWEVNGILHIVDVIQWAKQNLTDCETTFRFWWRDVKLSEVNDLAPPYQTTSRPPTFEYPCTLRPVPYTVDLSRDNLISTIIPLALSCVPYEVPVAPAGFPPSSTWAGSLASDGILLYVSEASYTFGSTPLALWIAPGPLEEGSPPPLEAFTRAQMLLPLQTPSCLESLRPSLADGSLLPPFLSEMSTPTVPAASNLTTPGNEKTEFVQTQPLLPGGRESTGADTLSAIQGQQNEETRYLPLVLKPVIPALLCVVMVLAGMGLEVAFYFSEKNKGWWTPADSATSWLHYLYTYPPVLVAMIFIAVWTAMDQEIMKMQPYVDLSRGDADANTSLLLDYTNSPKFIVWIYQTKNRHIVALLSTLVLLMLLASQPLCASLFTIRDTEFVRPNIGVPKFGVLGLNFAYSTLEGFASAAGFVEAQARYDLDRPPFVWQAWAVDEFERPTSFFSNGTMEANTTAIQTQPNCQLAVIDSYTTGNISATSAGCRFQQSIDVNATTSYGVKTADNCDDYGLMSKNADIRPVWFWFSAQAESSRRNAVVYCAPRLSLHYVTIAINLANGSLINVFPTGDYNEPNDLTSGGPPLYGGIWNGVDFNLTGASAVVSQRANTTRQQLPAAVFVAASRNVNGLNAVFDTPERWANLTTVYYRTFLALSSRTNYFVKDTTGDTLFTNITEIQKRVWLSPVAVHILAVVLIIAGFVGMTLHYLHFQLRKGVKLYAQPGTIASAASITSDSGLSALVKPGFNEEQLRDALRGRKFTVDHTGRVILQDDGFGPERPLEKRRSVYGQLMRAAR